MLLVLGTLHLGKDQLLQPGAMALGTPAQASLTGSSDMHGCRVLLMSWRPHLGTVWLTYGLCHAKQV